MKSRAICLVGPALALIVATLWNVQVVAEKKGRPLFARENADMPRHSLVEPPAIASSVAICESTGFEAVEGPCGWELGWICGSTFTACSGPPIPASCSGNPLADMDCCISNANPLNGWYVSGANQHCDQPTIKNLNPSTGEQHMRITRDPAGGNPPGCTGFSNACRVNAFTSVGASGVQPPGTSLTISVDVAMGLPYATPPFGSSMVWLGVYDPVGINMVWYFHYYGVFFVYDDLLDAYAGVVSMFGDGNYQTFRAELNPCDDVIDYYVDDVLSYSTAVADGEYRLSRGIFTANNVGNFHDVDNYSIIRHPPCEAFCGNEIATLAEECDGTDDGNCPGRCVPPGTLDECTCARPCSDCADPCPVGNGHSGPFLTTGGLFSYTADSPFTSIDTCGSEYDTVLFWNLSNNCTESELVNDECNEMTDALGQDAGDPSAACYAAGQFPLDSCLCAATVPGQAYTFAIIEYGGSLPALGETHMINIRKKAACGQPVLGGACCRGLIGTCEDGVSANECAGAFDTYYSGKLCSSPSTPACEAVTGACCFSIGGSDASCSENLTEAECNAMPPTVFWEPGAPCVGPFETCCACLNDDDCFDGDLCTVDACSGCICHNTPIVDWNPTSECCDAATGAVCAPIPADVCDSAACSLPGNRGVCVHVLRSEGEPCAGNGDGDPCTVFDTCGGAGPADCSGADLNELQLPCFTDEYCQSITDAEIATCVDGLCRCGTSPIPTTSHWGLVALCLSLLIGAKLLRHARPATSPLTKGGSA